jgi:hypothetical protein
MTTRAVDDADAISKRLAELREEAKQNLRCTCRLSDDGGRVETTDCTVHGAQPDDGALGLYWPPSALLSDDWDELRAQVTGRRGGR